MTNKPERSVEELREDLRNKILDIETAVRLTYNKKDSDKMIDKLLNHYTQTLKAERQRCEEVVEEAVRAEREKHLSDLIRIAQRIIKKEVTVQEFLKRWEGMLESLTQTDNPK